MTRDEILAMASEAEIDIVDGEIYGSTNQAIFRFAALVAEREREACAKACDVIYKAGVPSPFEKGRYIMADASDCAAAIRARGQS